MNQSPTSQQDQQSKRRHSNNGSSFVKRVANRAAYPIRGATYFNILSKQTTGGRRVYRRPVYMTQWKGAVVVWVNLKGLI